MKFKFVILLFLLVGCATTSASQQVYFNLKMENTEQGDYYNSVYYNVPIVLEFYFNSCPACNKNAPKVKRLANNYHNFFNQVIDVSIDCDKSDYNSWIRKYGDLYPVLNDCERTLADSLGITAYPTTVVLDADHNVVYKAIGTWDSQKEAKIKSFLKTSH